MFLWGLFVLAAVASATEPSSPPNDRPVPPGCTFPSGPYVPPECPPNEYFEVCSYKCPSENCPSYPEEPCDPGDGCCKNACRCKEGFSRNKEGKCIPYDQCEPDCPKRCRPTCKVPNPTNCTYNPSCTYCGSGKVYNENKGQCVKISECPYDQGCNGDPNATIKQNPPPCPSTCDSPNEFPCKKMSLPVGCVCKPSFILSEIDGKCIKPDDCPCGNPCGVNGTFSPCSFDCSTEFCPENDNPQPVCDAPINCPSGCVCKHKYQWKSREDKSCILAQECPVMKCTRPYEAWDRCPNACHSDSCDNYNKTLICNTFVEPECRPQCRCIKGYARDDNGNCIKGEKCPKKCQANASYNECGSACPKTCKQPNGPEACILSCVAGCECNDGFVLHDGECIEPSQCPPKKCQANASYNECGSACPKTCKQPNGPEACILSCVAGCECNDGFVLHDGECIEPSQCPPPTCQPHASFSNCSSACPKTCKQPHGAKICTDQCVIGCVCDDDYVLNTDTGECIKVEECPPTCQPNASFSNCSSACPKTCKQPNGSLGCTKQCVIGCVCDDGYVLNTDTGECVKVEKCPPTCQPHASFSNCSSACPKTCKQPNGAKICTAQCVIGCVCDDSYVLNTDNGQCVKLEECPPTCQPHASFSNCSSACPKTCKQPNGAKICTEQCVIGCVCDDGYVLNTDNGQCVKLEKCPKKCQDNATYKKCPSACPKTCDNPTGPQVCNKMCLLEGCECNKDYVLNTVNGQCVKVEQCPKKCQKNATYKDCPSACPKTCKEPNGPQVCTKMCLPKGCECDDGFVLNTDNGQCIKLKDCPKICQKNATYKDCPSACPKTCEQPDGPQVCKKLCLVKGCECDKGFVLNTKNGECVKLNKCPCKKNATYKKNPAACPKTCQNPDGPKVCNKAGLAYGCECDCGYVLNDNGDCVQLKDCPRKPRRGCTSSEEDSK